KTAARGEEQELSVVSNGPSRLQRTWAGSVTAATTAGRRGRELQLRRSLLTADVLSGAFAGTCIVLAHVVEGPSVLIPVVALAIGWPVAVRLCGLDSAGGLRFWTSGAAETWRLVAAALLVSWPVFGVLQALDAPSATTGALVAAALAAGS